MRLPTETRLDPEDMIPAIEENRREDFPIGVSTSRRNIWKTSWAGRTRVRWRGPRSRTNTTRTWGTEWNLGRDLENRQNLRRCRLHESHLRNPSTGCGK